MSADHTGTCRGCGEAVRWAEMIGSGKRNPLNLEPDPGNGNIIITPAKGGRLLAIHVAHLNDQACEAAKRAGVNLYLSHFATCPERERFRKEESDAETS